MYLLRCQGITSAYDSVRIFSFSYHQRFDMLTSITIEDETRAFGDEHYPNMHKISQPINGIEITMVFTIRKRNHSFISFTYLVVGLKKWRDLLIRFNS